MKPITYISVGVGALLNRLERKDNFRHFGRGAALALKGSGLFQDREIGRITSRFGAMHTALARDPFFAGDPRSLKDFPGLMNSTSLFIGLAPVLLGIKPMIFTGDLGHAPVGRFVSWAERARTGGGPKLFARFEDFTKVKNGCTFPPVLTVADADLLKEAIIDVRDPRIVNDFQKAGVYQAVFEPSGAAIFEAANRLKHAAGIFFGYPEKATITWRQGATRDFVCQSQYLDVSISGRKADAPEITRTVARFDLAARLMAFYLYTIQGLELSLNHLT